MKKPIFILSTKDKSRAQLKAEARLAYQKYVEAQGQAR